MSTSLDLNTHALEQLIAPLESAIDKLKDASNSHDQALCGADRVATLSKQFLEHYTLLFRHSAGGSPGLSNDAALPQGLDKREKASEELHDAQSEVSSYTVSSDKGSDAADLGGNEVFSATYHISDDKGDDAKQSGHMGDTTEQSVSSSKAAGAQNKCVDGDTARTETLHSRRVPAVSERTTTEPCSALGYDSSALGYDSSAHVPETRVEATNVGTPEDHDRKPLVPDRIAAKFVPFERADAAATEPTMDHADVFVGGQQMAAPVCFAAEEMVMMHGEHTNVPTLASKSTDVCHHRSPDAVPEQLIVDPGKQQRKEPGTEASHPPVHCVHVADAVEAAGDHANESVSMVPPAALPAAEMSSVHQTPTGVSSLALESYSTPQAAPQHASAVESKAAEPTQQASCVHVPLESSSNPQVPSQVASAVEREACVEQAGASRDLAAEVTGTQQDHHLVTSTKEKKASELNEQNAVNQACPETNIQVQSEQKAHNINLTDAAELAKDTASAGTVREREVFAHGEHPAASNVTSTPAEVTQQNAENARNEGQITQLPPPGKLETVVVEKVAEAVPQQVPAVLMADAAEPASDHANVMVCAAAEAVAPKHADTCLVAEQQELTHASPAIVPAALPETLGNEQLFALSAVAAKDRAVESIPQPERQPDAAGGMPESSAGQPQHLTDVAQTASGPAQIHATAALIATSASSPTEKVVTPEMQAVASTPALTSTGLQLQHPVGITVEDKGAEQSDKEQAGSPAAAETPPETAPPQQAAQGDADKNASDQHQQQNKATGVGLVQEPSQQAQHEGTTKPESTQLGQLMQPSVGNAADRRQQQQDHKDHWVGADEKVADDHRHAAHASEAAPQAGQQHQASQQSIREPTQQVEVGQVVSVDAGQQQHPAELGAPQETSSSPQPLEIKDSHEDVLAASGSLPPSRASVVAEFMADELVAMIVQTASVLERKSTSAGTPDCEHAVSKQPGAVVGAAVNPSTQHAICHQLVSTPELVGRVADGLVAEAKRAVSLNGAVMHISREALPGAAPPTASDACQYPTASTPLAAHAPVPAATSPTASDAYPNPTASTPLAAAHAPVPAASSHTASDACPNPTSSPLAAHAPELLEQVANELVMLINQAVMPAEHQTLALADTSASAPAQGTKHGAESATGNPGLPVFAPEQAEQVLEELVSLIKQAASIKRPSSISTTNDPASSAANKGSQAVLHEQGDKKHADVVASGAAASIMAQATCPQSQDSAPHVAANDSGHATPVTSAAAPVPSAASPETSTAAPPVPSAAEPVTPIAAPTTPAAALESLHAPAEAFPANTPATEAASSPPPVAADTGNHASTQEKLPASGITPQVLTHAGMTGLVPEDSIAAAPDASAHTVLTEEWCAEVSPQQPGVFALPSAIDSTPVSTSAPAVLVVGEAQTPVTDVSAGPSQEPPLPNTGSTPSLGIAAVADHMVDELVSLIAGASSLLGEQVAFVDGAMASSELLAGHQSGEGHLS
jgi:hypothetical protein